MPTTEDCGMTKPESGPEGNTCKDTHAADTRMQQAKQSRGAEPTCGTKRDIIAIRARHCPQEAVAARSPRARNGVQSIGDGAGRGGRWRGVCGRSDGPHLQAGASCAKLDGIAARARGGGDEVAGAAVAAPRKDDVVAAIHRNELELLAAGAVVLCSVFGYHGVK